MSLETVDNSTCRAAIRPALLFMLECETEFGVLPVSDVIDISKTKISKTKVYFS